MPRRKQRYAFVAVLLGVVGCFAEEPAACSKYQKPVSSAAVLDAIGNGQFAALVECGLAPDAPLPVNGQVVTPLQFAASLGRPHVVEQIVRAGADPNFAGTEEPKLPPLEIALSKGKYAAAEALIQLRARVDYALSSSGSTALMAISFDRTHPDAVRDMAKRLVGRGSSVDATDAKGNTALHWASRSANADYVAALLELRANACVQNKKNERPSALTQNAELKTLLERACAQR
jgi:ankyrin repeat protein